MIALIILSALESIIAKTLTVTALLFEIVSDLKLVYYKSE